MRLHVARAHGKTADQYREAHGLRRRGLVATGTLEVIAANVRDRFGAKAAFVIVATQLEPPRRA